MATILVVDDHESIREAVAAIVRGMGHRAVVAGSAALALELQAKHAPDFIVTDLKMEGMDGVGLLAKLRERDPDLPTMIMTAYGTVETAVEAMRLGAFDFIQKPFSPEVVRLKVERALELRAARAATRRLESENEYLRAEAAGRYRAASLIGDSEPMRRLAGAIEKVAATDATVLITGESGTGKELVAHALHAGSRRAAGPLIKVNCGALAETLLESELFGHERGAFTGAVRRKPGRFELADGGTILLDEIGEVSPAVQVKLLRVLQEKSFERVGGEQTLKVDARVVAATNKDLAALVAAGRFREDLYFRLNVVPLALPPLRERPGDIPALVEHFIAKLAPRTNPKVVGIDDDALARLMAHSWPGNVRELENAIEQSLVFAEGVRIGVSALPASLRGPAEAPLDVPHDRALPDILDDLERQLILKAWAQARGVKTETARLLGVKTSALYYKLEKYGIK